MAPPLSTAPLPGVRDFFPEEMSVRQQVFARLYQVVESFGYVKYDGPMLEPFELYAAKSGEELVNQQVYRFTDKGEREVALRPEMTPTVARMIAQRAGSLTLPARWYSHPNLYRYERKQRGRYREHWQVNVDVFGTASHEAEAEIFTLLAEMMFALGARTEDFLIRVSDRSLVQAVLQTRAKVPSEKLPAIYGILDRLAKIGETESRKALVALEVDADTVLEILAASTQDFFDRWSPSEALDASNIARVLREGIVTTKPVQLVFDQKIVRGFEYYTNSVFELYDVDPANPRSIAGGGRYDNLVRLFDEKLQIPGIGFGMGDVTLIDFLQTHGIAPAARVAADVIVLSPTPDDPAQRKRLREIGRDLRVCDEERGLRVTVPLESRKLGKQLERAAKEGVRFAVIAGAAEAERGAVKLRDLQRSDEREVPIAGLRAAILRILDENERRP